MGRLRAPPTRLKAPPSRLRSLPGVAGGERRNRGLINTAEWQRFRAKVIEAAWVEAVAAGGMLRCPHSGVVLDGVHPAPNSPVVHHIEPHRNDRALCFDRGNVEVVAKQWHDSDAQRIEKGGAPYRVENSKTGSHSP